MSLWAGTVAILWCLLVGRVGAGIPGFSKFLRSKALSSTTTVFPRGKLMTIPGGVDHLCLDMNCVLHPCYRNERSPARVFQGVFAALDVVITLVQPKKSIVMAFDGMAPFAKLLTQRKRRDSSPDSAALTAGTDLMSMMEDNMIAFFMQRLRRPGMQNITLFISSPDYPGEGEVKLVDWLRFHLPDSAVNDTVAIVGSDSDLVVQSLVVSSRVTSLARPDPVEVHHVPLFPSIPHIISREIDGSMAFRNVTQLHKAWAQTLGLPSNRPQAASDTALLFLLLGNDYLPRLLGGMDLREMMTAFKNTMARLPVEERLIFDHDTLSFYWPTWYELMKELVLFEDTMPISLGESSLNGRGRDLRVQRPDPTSALNNWMATQKIKDVQWTERVFSSVANAERFYQEQQKQWRLQSPWSTKAPEATREIATNHTSSSSIRILLDYIPGEGYPSDSKLQGTRSYLIANSSGTFLHSAQQPPEKIFLPPQLWSITASIDGRNFTPEGVFTSRKLARRAVCALALQLLDASAYKLYLQAKAEAYQLQETLDGLLVQADAHVAAMRQNDCSRSDVNRGSNDRDTNTTLSKDTDIAMESSVDFDLIAFIQKHGGPAGRRILREVPLHQLRRANDDDIECYLRGLLWTMQMYLSGACPDYSYHYSTLRPFVSASDILHYLDRHSASARDRHATSTENDPRDSVEGGQGGTNGGVKGATDLAKDQQTVDTRIAQTKASIDNDDDVSKRISARTYAYLLQGYHRAQARLREDICVELTPDAHICQKLDARLRAKPHQQRHDKHTPKEHFVEPLTAAMNCLCVLPPVAAHAVPEHLRPLWQRVQQDVFGASPGAFSPLSPTSIDTTMKRSKGDHQRSTSPHWRKAPTTSTSTSTSTSTTTAALRHDDTTAINRDARDGHRNGYSTMTSASSASSVAGTSTVSAVGTTTITSTTGSATGSGGHGGDLAFVEYADIVSYLLQTQSSRQTVLSNGSYGWKIVSSRPLSPSTSADGAEGGDEKVEYLEYYNKARYVRMVPRSSDAAPPGSSVPAYNNSSDSHRAQTLQGRRRPPARSKLTRNTYNMYIDQAEAVIEGTDAQQKLWLPKAVFAVPSSTWRHVHVYRHDETEESDC